MWNSFDTSGNDGVTASVTMMEGANGDQIHAYVARPDGTGPFPGLVLAHHVPGWDEFYRETARRFAQHGYDVICPDLFCRDGHGMPDDVAAKVRAAGGVPDDRVVQDLGAAMTWLRALPSSNGKVGILGSCSGGRHAVLAASRLKGFDAAVDCWGGRVVMTPEQISQRQTIAPIDLTKDLSAPLLGLFGNEDKSPTAAEVDRHEAELKKHAKTYEFHRYDGAGHGIFYYHWPMYRQQQAMDAWGKIFAFLDKYLG